MPKRLSPFAKLLLYLIIGIVGTYIAQVNAISLWLIALTGCGISLFFHLQFYEFSRIKRVIGFQLGVFLVFSSVGALLVARTGNEAGLTDQKFGDNIYASAVVRVVHFSDSATVINIALLNGYAGDTVFDVPFGATVKDKQKKFLNLLPDDEIFIEGKVQPFFENTNPGAFNYREYMEQNGKYFQVKANTLNILHRPKWSIWRAVYQVRNHLSNVLRKHLEYREFGVAQALVLGQKQYLEPETKQAFAGVGAMHILAVSGLHVGLVFLLFNWLFKPLQKLPNGHIVQTVLVILVIVGYAAITGLSPSVTRASLMFALISVGNMLRRVGDIYNTIFASAFLMLLYNPDLLFSIGFQLSYIAVLGIIFIYPKLFKCLAPKYWITVKLWSLLCLAIAAQLVTFPLGIYYFHQFPTYFFITNLIVIPAAFVLLLGGFVLFFSNAITQLGFSIVEAWLGWMYQKVVWLLNECIEILYAFPVSSIAQLEISELQLFIIYLFIISTVVFLVYKSSFFLRVGMLMIFLLCVSFTWNKYDVLRSSGVLVYQYNTSVVEVFEGKKSRCYAGFVHPQQQFYFDRMIQDFNRHEGRVTDTIVEAKLLKRNRVEQVSLVKGENEIQLLEKSILIKLEDRRQKEEFSLDSARIFQVCN